MIVCHCNVILRAEINEVIRGRLAADASACLEPQSIYRELQKRGRCCSCFPMVRQIVETVLKSAISEADVVSLAATSVDVELTPKDGHEGQRSGYRAA